MNEDEKITIREVKEDDFRKGILSGEVIPHDVEIIIKFKNGKVMNSFVSWETIYTLYKFHNKCAVGEIYELMIENSLLSNVM